MSKDKKPPRRNREMIPVKPELHALLKTLAAKNSRPLSWEADLMIREHLRRAGVEVPDLADDDD